MPILASLCLEIKMPERLRFRSGDDEALAWSNAFRQSSHDETLVKIIVCGDELILRIGVARILRFLRSAVVARSTISTVRPLRGYTAFTD